MPKIEERYKGAKMSAQIFNVSPTLIIGLGGSGKEVLMRLRRLFYTNIREVGLPINQYLWIDTDPQRQDIQGHDYDEISSALYFPETDIIDAQVNPKDLKNYFSHRAKYNHIFEWLHPSVENLGENAITNGTGKVRPCGRLAFFHHYEKIRDMIRNKLNVLRDQKEIKVTENKFGFDVDGRRTNVFLIASVAGGTGAGMFLDTAFLLKAIDPNIVLTGILFLPSIFEDFEKGAFKREFCSNGYASLMELDYFMAPKVGLDLSKEDLYSELIFKWDGKEHPLPAAPFYNVYFIGWENDSGKVFHSYTETFQMAAEFIYLEFSNSQFGDNKRSIRVNLQDYLINETRFSEMNPKGLEIFSQYFPNRYSSFGLSFIKLDIDRKRNAAAYFFGKSLADFWKRSQQDTEGVMTEIHSALAIEDKPGKIWNADMMRQFFLKRPDEEKNLLDTHEERILNDFGVIEKSIVGKFDHKAVKALYNFYIKELKSFPEEIASMAEIKWTGNIKRIDGDLGPNGCDLKQIIENAEDCFKKMKTSFITKFHELLSMPGEAPGKAGIGWASEFLKRFMKELEKIASKGFTIESLPDRKCPLNLPPIKEDINLEKQLSYLKEGKRIKAPLFANTAVTQYHQTVESSLKRYLGDAKDDLIRAVEAARKELLEWCRASFHNKICDRATNILDSLWAEIEDIKKQLDNYDNGLTELSEKQDSMFSAYNKDQEDVRYHSVNPVTNDEWFRGQVKKTLQSRYVHGHALSWEEFLNEETNKFLEKLATATNSERRDDGTSARQWGFRYLFSTVSNRIGRSKEWKMVQEQLADFCGAQLFNHEKGNLVFYTELAAFPLCQIGEKVFSLLFFVLDLPV